ncbi:hypothetical protein [Lampropedia hyalina]|jgi:hypothetical protein|uniref:hypothetical protein n=1 Tax=Lampropedia hyalina TaxID=198706 RepID=UPI001161322D|nr:hypothetical protein [Lampropedia hyalina]
MKNPPVRNSLLVSIFSRLKNTKAFAVPDSNREYSWHSLQITSKPMGKIGQIVDELLLAQHCWMVVAIDSSVYF